MIGATRVVVGVDGSLSSLAAVRRAAAEARRRDAPLVPVAAWTACDGDSLRPLSELEYAARVRLDSVIELALDGLPLGVRIHPQVVRSEAGRALVATADGPQDLLVLGSGRHTGHRRPLHGSVARYCLARAACEVLIVPPTAMLEPAPGEDTPSWPGTEDDCRDAAGPHCHAGVGYLN